MQLEDVQKRAEAAEAALQEERTTHKRLLRHKNRELAEAQVSTPGCSVHAALPNALPLVHSSSSDRTLQSWQKKRSVC